MRLKKYVVTFGLVFALALGMAGCKSADDQNSGATDTVVTENQEDEVVELIKIILTLIYIKK